MLPEGAPYILLTRYDVKVESAPEVEVLVDRRKTEDRRTVDVDGARMDS